jgi:hypothetical protein
MKYPCYTTSKGIRIGSEYLPPPRYDAPNEDELFWQRAFLPAKCSFVERILPPSEVLWRWAAIIAWIIVGVVLTAKPAHAQFANGNMLYDNMTSSSPVEKTFVSGYVAAVADVLVNADVVCIPRGVNINQMKDVAKAFMDANPAQRHQRGDSILTVAYMQAWPCPKRGKDL